MPNAKPVPAGTQYGEWTTTAYSAISGTGVKVPAICSCGFSTNVSIKDLKSGHSTRCRTCANKKSMKIKVGDVFGLITVTRVYLNDSSNNSGGSRVDYLCACGKRRFNIPSRTLAKSTINKRVPKSCGCARNEWLSDYPPPSGDSSPLWKGGREESQRRYRYSLLGITKHDRERMTPEEQEAYLQEIKDLLATQGIEV